MLAGLQAKPAMKVLSCAEEAGSLASSVGTLEVATAWMCSKEGESSEHCLMQTAPR